MGFKGNVEAGSDPSVEILVIDGDRSGVKPYLAFPVGVCLACHKAPLPYILPLLTRVSTVLDKLVDCGQYVMWCDRKALISEEIDENIWDGQKIWYPEYRGCPVPSCRRPKVSPVRLHLVELTEFVEIRYRLAGVPLPSLCRR